MSIAYLLCSLNGVPLVGTTHGRRATLPFSGAHREGVPMKTGRGGRPRKNTEGTKGEGKLYREKRRGTGILQEETEITEWEWLKHLIPNRFQAETNPLVFCATGCVARSLQTAAGMRLTRALPVSQNPARLSLILKAHWN